MKNSRRSFIRNSIGGMGLLGLPAALRGKSLRKEEVHKIVCVGGHPDDPESGCGGTLARLSDLGHLVTNVYLTTGEAGIEGKSHEESASIRRKEAIKACEVLKAKPVFAGQIDGDTVINRDWIKKMLDILKEESPDIIFTHWPVDSHPDHQAASILTIQSWLRMNRKCMLYFFEVLTGKQSMIFNPTDYVDINETQDQKKKAVYCHVSQKPDEIYSEGHTAMEEFRGMEFGVKAAEAFVKLNGRTMGGVVQLYSKL